MSTAEEALARYDRFNDDCMAEDYTDTGEAWQVLHTLASALRNKLMLEARPSTGSPAWYEQQEDRCNPVHPDSPAGKGDPQRDGNLGEVIDRRVQVYGDPVTGIADIAGMWSVYLGRTIQAYEVPMMFILMKIIRSKTSPDYSDHSDDIEGYLDIFRKVIGEDMIQARTVNEYIEQKWGKS